MLAKHGIYSIIDLHQDAWSATLAARDNETCPEGRVLALGWDGAPAWATLDEVQPRCTIAGIRETSPAVRTAWVAFWQDSPGQDGVGIRTRYAQMLGHIAERFAVHAAVAGYDVMNEPNAFTPTEQSGLAALYEDSLREIRAAEERANGFPHLLFFEPSALWSQAGEGPPNDFIRDANVVYSPHIYTGGFNGGDISREAFQIARDEAALFDGAPVFSGEWGSDPDRASPDGDSYFLDHLRYQDDFHFSSSLWTWRESCGDPHKTADYRAGRIPEVWGEFEVDCTDNSVNGLRQDLVRQLTRPALHAAPGRIETISYDPVSGSFRASGIEATGGQLVIFYPAAKHGQPTVTSSNGLNEIRELEGPGNQLYLIAEVIDSTWSLAVSP
jgi:endoglycosylceramidase